MNFPIIYIIVYIHKMIPRMFVLVFCLCLSVAVTTSLEVRPCGSNKTLPLSVTVDGCDKEPCKVTRKRIPFSIDFEARKFLSIQFQLKLSSCFHIFLADMLSTTNVMASQSLFLRKYFVDLWTFFFQICLKNSKKKIRESRGNILSKIDPDENQKRSPFNFWFYIID